jgi:hypothetical protein
MKYLPLDISTEHRANLKILADGLAGHTPPPNFTMGEYFLTDGKQPDWGVEITKDDYTCGTVACAVGHGPFYGIPKQAHEGWSVYAYRAFGAAGWLYGWLFNGAWLDRDNTARGAAKRIQIALEHGVPANTYAQLRGEEPLCYTVDASTESA